VPSKQRTKVRLLGCSGSEVLGLEIHTRSCSKGGVQAKHLFAFWPEVVPSAMAVGAGGGTVVILGDEGNKGNTEAYKASRVDDSLHCEHRKRVNIDELVGFNRVRESSLDRSVPCPQWLGQPAQLLGRRQEQGSGRQPSSSIFREVISPSSSTLAKEGDGRQVMKHSAQFLSPRRASPRMVSNRLNHAGKYFIVRFPANHLSTGQCAHCAWEESSRMSRDKPSAERLVQLALICIACRSGVLLTPPSVFRLVPIPP
jgi:hypothetical protein